MQQPSGTGRRILVVDDHDDVRETIRLLLEMDGYEVVEARDARGALELSAKGRFDLVMTDYALPGMLGDELARTLKRLDPTRPVILLSGSVDDLQPTPGGADLVLNKPFRLEELQQALNRLGQSGPACPTVDVLPRTALGGRQDPPPRASTAL